MSYPSKEEREYRKDLLAQGLKKCTRCEEVKPLDAFYPMSKDDADGRRHSYCRECVIEKVHKHQEAHPRPKSIRRKHRLVLLARGLQVCAKCKETKVLEDFTPSKKGFSGRGSYCHACSAIVTRERIRNLTPGQRTAYIAREVERQRRRRAGPDWPQRGRRQALRQRYGITPEYFEMLAARQGGRCAICNEQPDKLCIDHCHETGELRALLCRGCNTGLGVFRDRPDRLMAAIVYLRRFAKQQGRGA